MEKALNSRRVCRALAGAVALCIVVPTEAFAYIDPGTGSMAYQAVLAIALGLSVFVRGIRARLGQFLSARVSKHAGGKPEVRPRV
jgi:hypothetical protein